jgi:hypothetical protein
MKDPDTRALRTPPSGWVVPLAEWFAAQADANWARATLPHKGRYLARCWGSPTFMAATALDSSSTIALTQSHALLGDLNQNLAFATRLVARAALPS